MHHGGFIYVLHKNCDPFHFTKFGIIFSRQLLGVFSAGECVLFLSGFRRGLWGNIDEALVTYRRGALKIHNRLLILSVYNAIRSIPLGEEEN